MKKLLKIPFLLLFAVAFLFASCEKDELIGPYGSQSDSFMTKDGDVDPNGSGDDVDGVTDGGDDDDFDEDDDDVTDGGDDDDYDEDDDDSGK